MKSKVITIIKENDKIFIDSRIDSPKELMQMFGQAFVRVGRDSALREDEIYKTFTRMFEECEI